LFEFTYDTSDKTYVYHKHEEGINLKAAYESLNSRRGGMSNRGETERGETSRFPKTKF
jgi:hypothetical protein